MDELALFAGAGGGILGSVLCGWRTVAAVEIDPKSRASLLARQRDGVLDRFPIWDDVETFDGLPWRGRVGLVSGGPPCQPHSTASRGRKVAVDRWPDMHRIVGEVAPPRVLVENVQRDPIERAACDLLRLGYGCTIFEASAAAVGAPHPRPRWWVAADTDRKTNHVLTLDGQVARLRAGASAVWREHPARDHDVLHGLARGLDRCERAIGNGQVPQVVLAIARALGWVSPQRTSSQPSR